MKIIDETETQKKTNNNKKNNNKQREKRTRGGQRLRVRVKWFCCIFKLGFLQLICKASLIFKSNLELALSIIKTKRIM